MNQRIKEKLKLLPKTPGVYLMKDEDGKVIYVGKAIVLKNRVSQYFNSAGQHNSKTRALVEHIADFDYVVCNSETEALILETNLIKEYMPKYNILLKDDKHYPYVRVDYGKMYPTFEIVRKISNDGCKYFGPFLNSMNLSKILDAVYEIYPVRTCKKDITDVKKDMRPCLNFQLGRCPGMCALDVDRDEYLKNVNRVADFLNGKTAEVTAVLKQKMTDYAEKLEFEKAGKMRDLIEEISEIILHQSASVSSMDNRDIIGIAKGDSFAIVHLLIMRRGKVIGSSSFKMDLLDDSDLKEVLYAFLLQYYNNSEIIPKEILLPFETDSMEAVCEHFEDIAKVKLLVPVRGEKRKMVLMAMKNAMEDILKQKKDRNWNNTKGAALALKEALNLKTELNRIECFDISHTGGRDTVGSKVVFTDGKPDKKEYRRFKIKETDGVDDYASMREIVTRSLKRSFESGVLPDLIIVDGGKGQVSAAIEAMEKLQAMDIPLMGLAERNEEIFLPNRSEPVILSRNSRALKLIQALRDEAHRFAITYHRGLRNKSEVLSELDGVEGVGKVRKQALFRYFKSIDKIKSASEEELAGAEGIDKKTAKSIYNFFREQNNGEKI